jgi:predicted nicotinamide N-methyase
MRDFIIKHTELATAPLVPEIRLRLLRADSPLWRAFGDGEDARGIPRPYWAFAWSGGQSLARYVLDHREVVAGRRVLDFAAGCGIAAIAAARAGAARVSAAEIDPTAIAAIVLNAQENGVSSPLKKGTGSELTGITTATNDGHEVPVPLFQRAASVTTVCEDLIYSPNRGWDVVLVGDIWYDTRLARYGLNWLRSLAGEGAVVIAADPGRTYSPSQGIKELIRYRVRSVPDLEHPNLQECRVYRILPKNDIL